jgi:hypothetical protein
VCNKDTKEAVMQLANYELVIKLYRPGGERYDPGVRDGYAEAPGASSFLPGGYTR